MRGYAIFSPRWWTSAVGRAVCSAGPEAVTVALHLRTGPSSTMIGLYYLPLPTLCHETKLSLDVVLAALARLEAVGFARYDGDSEYVWVLGMADEELGGGVLKPKDHKVVGVGKLWADVRNCPFAHEFHARYGVGYQLSVPPSRRGFEGALEPLASGSEAPSEPLRRDPEPAPEPEPAGRGGAGGEGAAPAADAALDGDPELAALSPAERARGLAIGMFARAVLFPWTSATPMISRQFTAHGCKNPKLEFEKMRATKLTSGVRTRRWDQAVLSWALDHARMGCAGDRRPTAKERADAKAEDERHEAARRRRSAKRAPARVTSLIDGILKQGPTEVGDTAEARTANREESAYRLLQEQRRQLEAGGRKG